MMGASKGSIFICHSKRDLEIAIELRKFLEVQGFVPWIATEDLITSNSFPQAISDAIDTCQQVVVVGSKSAYASKWVERECLFAIDAKNKPTHIVQTDETDLPIYLIEHHAIDIRGNLRESGLKRLVRFLRKNGSKD